MGEIWIGLVKDQKLGLFRWTSEEAKPDIKGAKNGGEIVDYDSSRGKWNNKGCSCQMAGANLANTLTNLTKEISAMKGAVYLLSQGKSSPSVN